MNKSDVPQVSYAWWHQNQPKTLPPTGLGEALKAFEADYAAAKAMTDLDKYQETFKKYHKVLDTLEKLRPAVAAAIGKCKPVIHGPTKAVLQKYPGQIDGKKREVEAALKAYTDKLGSKLDKVFRICTSAKDFVKNQHDQFEKEYKKLVDINEDMMEAREAVAQARAHNEPNAGEMEVNAAEGYVRDAKRIYGDITQLVKDTRDHVRAQWNAHYDQAFNKLDPRFKVLEGSFLNIYGVFDAVPYKIDPLMASIESSAKSIRAMADEQGHLEDHYLEICNALVERCHQSCASIDASLRDAGGQLDKADFEAMNFRDEADPAKRDPALLVNSKGHLTQGVLLTGEAEKNLHRVRTLLDRSTAKFPAFVDKRDARFSKVLHDLGAVDSFIKSMENEIDKLKKKAPKSKASYEKSLALSQG